MAKFAANLSMMFTEVDFLQRFQQASASGFKAVEFLFPYDYEPEQLAHCLEYYQLEQALFNLFPGDWAAGERGFAAIPGQEQRFKESVELAIPYAKALKCKKLHVMSGIVDPNYTREQHIDTFIANIRYAADRFAEFEIQVLIEPLNSRDVPGYFLSHQREAVELIRQVERTNVALQFDVYHAQIMDGDLTVLIRELADSIGHVQIASVPDRHEPDKGELNFPHLFQVLDQVGYQGWIGCEYNPKNSTEEGLSWLSLLTQ